MTSMADNSGKGDEMSNERRPRGEVRAGAPGGPTPAEGDFLRLAAAVESSDDAIIANDLDGTIEAWNPAAERLYGYARAEAVGRPVAVLVPPEVRDEFDQTMERVRRGERIGTLETVRLRKDGSRVQVALTISPVRAAGGGLVGTSVIARDMSERRRMDAEVSKGRARLRAILDTAVDAIISIDGRGLIQTINPATERIFGYSSAELIGAAASLLKAASRPGADLCSNRSLTKWRPVVSGPAPACGGKPPRLRRECGIWTQACRNR